MLERIMTIAQNANDYDVYLHPDNGLMVAEGYDALDLFGRPSGPMRWSVTFTDARIVSSTGTLPTEFASFA